MKLIPALVFALCTACSNGADAPSPDAPTAEAAPPAPRLDLAPPDASLDAQVDAPPLEPTPLPLSDEDVAQIGGGDGIDVAAVAWADQSPAVHLLYEHFDRDFSAGELRRAGSSDDAGSFAAPTKLDLGSAAIHASPTVLVLAGGERQLYFVRTKGIDSGAELCRAPVHDGGDVGAVTVIEDAPPLGLLSWPKLYPLEDGRLALVYRDGLSRPSIAFGAADGLSFGTPRSVHPEGAAMPALGVFADGSLAYTYQAPSPSEPMISWVRRSSDGQSWSQPQRVTQSSPNVHDTTLIQRLDGELDLYYILVPPAAPTGFVLRRRALRSDGALGDEQQLTTTAAHGEPSKPGAHRLADGHLLLSYAQIAKRDPLKGWPTQQLLFVTKIAGDAPAP